MIFPITSSILLAAAIYMTILLVGLIGQTWLNVIITKKSATRDITANVLSVAVLWGLFYLTTHI